MSVDEIVMLHENFGTLSDFLLSGGNRDDTIFHDIGLWMFLIGTAFLIFYIMWVYSLS